MVCGYVLQIRDEWASVDRWGIGRKGGSSRGIRHGQNHGMLSRHEESKGRREPRDGEQRKPQSLEDSFDNGPTHVLCGLNDNHHTDREAGLLGLCPGFLTDTAVWPSA